MVSSKNNEWATPQDLFDRLNDEFHFTLDVAATHENAKCRNHFTIEDDGLKQDWGQNVCWMNPPYGGNTGKWIAKAWLAGRKGATVVCLIVSSTDRSYWHDYIFPYAYEIRFIRGRLKFGMATSTAPFASALVVFNGISSQTQPRIVYQQKQTLNLNYS